MNYRPYIAALAVPGMVLCAAADSVQSETDAKFWEICSLNYYVCFLILNLTHSNADETAGKIEGCAERIGGILYSFPTSSSMRFGSKEVVEKVVRNTIEMMSMIPKIGKRFSLPQKDEVNSIFEKNERLRKAFEHYKEVNKRLWKRMDFSDEEYKRYSDLMKSELSR